jgi:hypothetical protein
VLLNHIDYGYFGDVVLSSSSFLRNLLFSENLGKESIIDISPDGPFHSITLLDSVVTSNTHFLSPILDFTLAFDLEIRNCTFAHNTDLAAPILLVDSLRATRILRNVFVLNFSNLTILEVNSYGFADSSVLLEENVFTNNRGMALIFIRSLFRNSSMFFPCRLEIPCTFSRCLHAH